MKQHYIKTIFLCLSLLAGTNASAQTCIDGIYYNLNPRLGATVTYRNYSGGSYSGTVIIPDTITYNGKTYKVSTIGTRAFYNCHDLNSVTIGNKVTRLDESAFCGCSGLESINIPNSVTKIGNHAFHECSGLTSVTIGNSVTSIGQTAFADCNSLTSITIPNSVTSIGSSAFANCI